MKNEIKEDRADIKTFRRRFKALQARLDDEVKTTARLRAELAAQRTTHKQAVDSLHVSLAALMEERLRRDREASLQADLQQRDREASLQADLQQQRDIRAEKIARASSLCTQNGYRDCVLEIADMIIANKDKITDEKPWLELMIIQAWHSYSSAARVSVSNEFAPSLNPHRMKSRNHSGQTVQLTASSNTAEMESNGAKLLLFKARST